MARRLTAAQSAVGRAVAALRFGAEAGPVRDHIPKHGGSTLFDELGAAARAGDLDASASPGHPQLLAALGAAVVVVQFAVGPLLLQAAELVIEPVLPAVIAVVLLGALGDITAQAAVVAQDQQRRPAEYFVLLEYQSTMIKF